LPNGLTGISAKPTPAMASMHTGRATPSKRNEAKYSGRNTTIDSSVGPSTSAGSPTQLPRVSASQPTTNGTNRNSR